MLGEQLEIKSKNSEEVLLRQLIAGDPNGFAGIYTIHNRNIFRFIFKFVNSAPLAEDLTQEVFIKIWEGRLRLAEVQSFKAYLFITARNHTLNRLKEIFKSDVAMGEVIRGFTQLRNDTEDEILHKEYLQFLKRILNTLPERTKEIFKQCREQGRTYDEVATELNISRNAVKNHMVLAMKVLRSSVKRELGISISILLFIVFKN